MQTFKNCLDKIQQIKKEYDKVCTLLTYQEVLMDTKLCLKYQQQKLALEDIAQKYKNFLDCKNNIEELENIIQDSNITDIDKQQFNIELQNNKVLLESSKKMLIEEYFKLTSTYNNIVVEIVCKTNQQKLFLDLIKGYQNYCVVNNFVYKQDPQKNCAKLYISGLGAKKIFDLEKGTHKTTTDSDICYVFVYDDELQFNSVFDEEDITISTMRSSGAGGQHVNTTDSAIRATHNPTNISVVCQNERSQFQNKQKALENLKQKVTDFYLKQQNGFIEKQKKEQLILIKSNATKEYNYETGKIQKSLNKEEIFIKDFLSGNII